MPLSIMGVEAPESCTARSGELRVVPREVCLSSRFFGRKGFFTARKAEDMRYSEKQDLLCRIPVSYICLIPPLYGRNPGIS